MALSSSQLAVLFLLAFCFVLCATGFVAPYWEYKDILVPGGSDVKIDVGLWYACANAPGLNYDKCVALPWNLNSELVKDDTYFKALRVIMAGSMLLQLICVFVSVLTCCKKLFANNINFECIMGTLGGMAGIAGIATFSAFSKDTYHPFNDKLNPVDKGVHLEKGFAFYLTCAGSGAMLVCGLVGLCVPRRRPKYIESTVARERGYSNSSFSMEPKLRDAKIAKGDARDFL